MIFKNRPKKIIYNKHIVVKYQHLGIFTIGIWLGLESVFMGQIRGVSQGVEGVNMS